MRKFGFEELISSTAGRKRDAARARFGRPANAGEDPKLVYLEVGRAIAKAFEADGFRYLKSLPGMRRESGDFSHVITFQSSSNNVRGQYVALWIHVSVGSRNLKRWRSLGGAEGPSPFVAGGQIGNLEEPKGWAEWNVASRESWLEQVEEAVAAIRRIALPFFRGFTDRQASLLTVATWPAPGLEIRPLIEFLLCSGERAKAQALLEKYFHVFPDRLPAYVAALDEFAGSGLPKFWDAGSARDVAKLTVLHGLRPVSAA